ncbi:MAG: hypothetical protein AMXMBFR56_03400 [Polyangiaceae bacterium]
MGRWLGLVVALLAACSGQSSQEPGGGGGGGGGSGGVHTIDGGGGWGPGGADAGSACAPVGAKQPCYAGPISAAGIGVCQLGEQACSASGWGACVGSVLPSSESCGDGLDDDCDGSSDEGCQCASGDTQACGAESKGVCKPGKQLCVNGVWSPSCDGAVLPSPEQCNGKDDDCDGQIDDGNPEGGGACATGLAGPCAKGENMCSAGKLACKPNGDPNDPACKPCVGCLQGHADCNIACQKIADRPGGSCAAPTSTDPGACCSCLPQYDCSQCLAGFASCDAACQNAGYAEGYCAVNASTDPGNCCACLN